ncbi:MAG: hypothetical protein KUG77_26465 [Nannocystaceae bacterium]|nr:hypothetical protein [Nannocystaceae bacterium]
MRRSPTWNGRRDSWLRILGAVLGTLLPSALACSLLARVAPLSAAAATTLGVLPMFPVWTLAMTSALLLPTAGRVWLACLVALVVLGVPVALLGPLP